MDNIVFVEPTQPPIEVRVRPVKEMQRFLGRIRTLSNLDTTPLLQKAGQSAYWHDIVNLVLNFCNHHRITEAEMPDGFFKVMGQGSMARRILDAMIPRKYTGPIWRYEDILE